MQSKSWCAGSEIGRTVMLATEYALQLTVGSTLQEHSTFQGEQATQHIAAQAAQCTR